MHNLNVKALFLNGILFSQNKISFLRNHIYYTVFDMIT